MILHLKRFKALEGRRAKLNTMIESPLEGLDLSAFLTNASSRTVHYDKFELLISRFTDISIILINQKVIMNQMKDTVQFMICTQSLTIRAHWPPVTTLIFQRTISTINGTDMTMISLIKYRQVKLSAKVVMYCFINVEIQNSVLIVIGVYVFRQFKRLTFWSIVHFNTF